jgi:hypothetical protein
LAALPSELKKDRRNNPTNPGAIVPRFYFLPVIIDKLKHYKMDYNKLLWNLRKKAFDYSGEKELQYMSLLIKVKKICIANPSEERKQAYADQQEKLLFKLN